jgi:hypothetical protein
MAYRSYCLLSGTLFGLVALGHLLRILFGLSVDVGGVSVPMLASWFGAIVPGALSIWALRIVRGTKGAAR